MCKLTKNLPIQGGGLLDFQDLGEDFTKGRGIQGGGLKPPSELWSIFPTSSSSGDKNPGDLKCNICCFKKKLLFSILSYKSGTIASAVMIVYIR